MPLEEAVRTLTSAQADLFGLVDRGVLRPGAWADVVVFDPATVAPGPLRRVRDFPAGSERLTADAPTGVRHVLVNGTPIRLDGEQVADGAGSPRAVGAAAGALMTAPAIIEVALSTRPDRTPHAPTTLAEATRQGLECMAAGASVVHMHLPDLQVPAAVATEQYLEYFRSWLGQDPDVLAPADQRLRRDAGGAASATSSPSPRPGALRLAFVDPGATDLRLARAPTAPRPPTGYLYAFNYDAMSYAIDEGQSPRSGHALRLFEPGWLRNVMAYWRAGRLPAGSFVKFYFGGQYGVLMRGKGVTFGLPPTLTALAAYREILQLEGCELPWFSAVVGGDLLGTPVARATLEQGGHLRVGLEDHAGDRQPSNVDLVREAVALCAEVGRPVATPAEAGRLLGLPPRTALIPEESLA